MLWARLRLSTNDYEKLTIQKLYRFNALLEHHLNQRSTKKQVTVKCVHLYLHSVLCHIYPNAMCVCKENCWKICYSNAWTRSEAEF